MEKNTSHAKVHPSAEHKTDFIHDDTQQNLPENLSLKSAQPTATSWRGVLFTLMAAAISFAAYCLLPYDNNANKGLAILLFVGLLWLTEAVHITITAPAAVLRCCVVMLLHALKPTAKEATNRIFKTDFFMILSFHKVFMRRECNRIAAIL